MANANEFSYTIKSHSTRYKGINFRSRLEAKWAVFFDLLGWTWQYEPDDLNRWTPDFELFFGDETVLVEVKPFTDFPEQLFIKFQKSGRKGHVLLLSQFPHPLGVQLVDSWRCECRLARGQVVPRWEWAKDFALGWLILVGREDYEDKGGVFVGCRADPTAPGNLAFELAYEWYGHRLIWTGDKDVPEPAFNSAEVYPLSKKCGDIQAYRQYILLTEAKLLTVRQRLLGFWAEACNITQRQYFPQPTVEQRVTASEHSRINQNESLVSISDKAVLMGLVPPTLNFDKGLCPWVAWKLSKLGIKGERKPRKTATGRRSTVLMYPDCSQLAEAVIAYFEHYCSGYGFEKSEIQARLDKLKQ